MRAFHKEQVNHPIKHNGNPIPWEMVGRNSGVRNLDESRDAAIIALLDTEADSRRNGVRRISAETYESLKKNTNSARSTPPYEIVPPVRLHEPEALLPKLRSPENPAVFVNSLPSVPVSATRPTPDAISAGKPDAPDETPARKKAKRGKLSELTAKEQSAGEAP